MKNDLEVLLDQSRVDRLVEFMELVDCDPSEVLDTVEQIPLMKAAVKGRGSQVVYFGRYKGSRLSDVPSDYLRWACRERKVSGSFHRFQKQAKAELRRR